MLTITTFIQCSFESMKIKAKMSEWKEMHSSSPARTPKSQLAAEKPSTGGCWNPPRKRYPTSKDKADATMRWQEGQDHIKIKSHTCQVGNPQTEEQEYQRSSHTVANILGPTSDF